MSAPTICSIDRYRLRGGSGAAVRSSTGKSTLVPACRWLIPSLLAGYTGALHCGSVGSNASPTVCGGFKLSLVGSQQQPLSIVTWVMIARVSINRQSGAAGESPDLRRGRGAGQQIQCCGYVYRADGDSGQIDSGALRLIAEVSATDEAPEPLPVQTWLSYASSQCPTGR